MRFVDPYEILGLKPEASQEEVKAAYEALLEDDEKKEQAEAAYKQILNSQENGEPTEAALMEETAAEETEDAAENQPAAPAGDPEVPSEAALMEEKAAEETPEADPAEKPQQVSEEKPQETKMEKGATPGQIALGVLAIVVLAAVLAALILAALGGKEETPAEPTAQVETAGTEAPAETTEPTIPADGNPDDETCKGSYTGTPEEAKAAADKVVATVGDYQLTNGLLQVYYLRGIQTTLQGNPYLSYMGLDLSRGINGLDTQVCPIAEGRTWQQFFLQGALQDWHMNQAMAAEAEKHQVKLSQESSAFIEKLPADLEQQAKEGSFPNAAAMLEHNIGNNTTVEDYVEMARILELGFQHHTNEMGKVKPTDADLETYFKENEDQLREYGITRDSKVVSVRHILITPEDTESEDSWKKAEDQANALLAQFRAGEQTEENFSKLAQEHTMDPGSKETGGLYQDVIQGQMVPEFDQWCFDSTRKPADLDIVKTEYGYHIMYFVSSRSVFKEQVSQMYMNQKSQDLVSDALTQHPLTVDYSAIVLGTTAEQ